MSVLPWRGFASSGGGTPPLPAQARLVQKNEMRTVPSLSLAKRSPVGPFFAFACAFAFLFAFALVPLARAGTVTTDVSMYETSDAASIRISLPCNEWDGFGFMPVLVRVDNKANADRVWSFNFALSPEGRRSGKLSSVSSFSVAAPARASRTAVLWVPGSWAPTDEQLVTMILEVEGPDVHDGSWSNTLLQGWGRGGLRIAVSPKLEPDYQKKSSARVSGPGKDPNVSAINAADWPADWRVWSPFSFVVMQDAEFEALDAARQAALRDWVALGGRLYLKPKYSSAARTRRGNTITIPISTSHGLGFIVPSDLPTNLYMAAGGSDAEGLVTEALAGAASTETAMETPAVISIDEAKLDILRTNRVRPWYGFATLISDDERDEWQLSRATWWLIVFLIVFGVLIGPLNLFVFAPAGKRQRLFFTVPAISLGAALLMVAVIVFHDGFGGEGTRRALVVLLPGENKAVVVQQQVARTGMLLGSAFALPDDTLLAKTARNERDDVSGRTISRQAAATSGDWFTSRSVQEHVLMRITPTRARVELVSGGKDGAPPVVQSSMPGALRRFVYCDAAGVAWIADEVPAGRRVTLRTFNIKMPAKIQPGQFHAQSAGGELAPLATLGSIRWQDDAVTVIGRLEGAKAQ